MKISLTLPTLFPAALERTIANIRATSTHEIEVLVVAPFQPAQVPHSRGTLDKDNDQRVQLVWIEEQERRGCATAHHDAMLRASGDFILAWVDDHLFVDGWDAKAIANFTDREKRFQGGDNGGSPGRPFALGLRYVPPLDHVGTAFGMYYPFFPLMRLADARRLGWFLSDYRTSSFGDSDLGLRVWADGGRCEYSMARLIQIHESDNQRHKAVSEGAGHVPRWHADMKRFLQRWEGRYGKGWDTAHLRSFNLDFCPEEFPELAQDFSCCSNDDPNMALKVASRQATCLVESMADVNIVWHRQAYYTAPQSLGPIDWSAEPGQANPHIKHHDTLAEARLWISLSKRRQHRWWHLRRWRSELGRLTRMLGMSRQ